MFELQLTIFTYGPGESRVEIEARPPVPENTSGNARLIYEWANDFILGLGTDVKHTKNWDCSMCDKPARETKVHVASWSHLSPPRMVLYVFHLCEAGRNPCHQAVINQNRLMNLMGGCPLPARERLSKPIGSEFPLAASCLGCKKDETAKPGVKMSRCGGCKLVRYCGTRCQTDDWQRHKKVCKHIKSVKWVR